MLIVNRVVEPPVWFELHPRDGFQHLSGCRYRLFKMGGEPAKELLGKVPRCLAEPA